MSVVEFVIPGRPVGKMRPRFSSRGPFVRTYTPKETMAYESLVRVLAQVEAGPEFKPIDGGVGVEMTMRLDVPQSWSKKKRALALAQKLAPISRPDIDNVLKSVLDGVSGVLFNNDSQVGFVQARKEYADSPPLLIVRVYSLDP